MFLLKWIMYLLFFFYCMFLFFPKESMYFKFEELLNKQNITINEKIIKDNYTNINIEKIEIYYDGIRIAYLNKIKFLSYFYKTNLTLEELEFSDDVMNIIKGNISKLDINYSIINPKFIIIDGNSTFGKIEGNVDILNRVIQIELALNSSGKKQIKNISQYFKLKKGKYIYEYKY